MYFQGHSFEEDFELCMKKNFPFQVTRKDRSKWKESKPTGFQTTSLFQDLYGILYKKMKKQKSAV